MSANFFVMARAGALVLALAGAASLCLPMTAMAQDADPAVKAKPLKAKKPPAKSSGARRPGELEGWSPEPAKRSAGDSSGRVSPRQPSQDGGLPLPNAPASAGGPPIGFGPSGNVGSSFKF